MPTYEYLCRECNKIFSMIMSMAEHEAGTVTCPKCNSHKATQQFSTFFAKTSKKS